MRLILTQTRFSNARVCHRFLTRPPAAPQRLQQRLGRWSSVLRAGSSRSLQPRAQGGPRVRTREAPACATILTALTALRCPHRPGVAALHSGATRTPRRGPGWARRPLAVQHGGAVAEAGASPRSVGAAPHGTSPLRYGGPAGLWPRRGCSLLLTPRARGEGPPSLSRHRHGGKRPAGASPERALRGPQTPALPGGATLLPQRPRRAGFRAAVIPNGYRSLSRPAASLGARPSALCF